MGYLLRSGLDPSFFGCFYFLLLLVSALLQIFWIQSSIYHRFGKERGISMHLVCYRYKFSAGPQMHSLNRQNDV